MVISSLEAQEVEYVPSSKGENANIVAPGPQIKKLRTLSFLQLLKFKKAKYPHCLIYGSGADILAIFPVTI